MSWEAILVILVMAAMLTALFFELMPPELLVLLAMLIVWNAGAFLSCLVRLLACVTDFRDWIWHAGIINSTDALAGFSNEGMITVGALFVVVKGVEKRCAVHS